MDVKYNKRFGFKILSFNLGKMITDENDILKGLTIFILNKKVLNIIHSNVVWTNDKGIPYKIGIEDNVLFINKFAIGI